MKQTNYRLRLLERLTGLETLFNNMDSLAYYDKLMSKLVVLIKAYNQNNYSVLLFGIDTLKTTVNRAMRAATMTSEISNYFVIVSISISEIESLISLASIE